MGPKDVRDVKTSLSGDFMALLPMYQYFGNSAEEFYPHKTLYSHETLIISLHQYGATSAYLISMKL
jgi:hypothetical protein